MILLTTALKGNTKSNNDNQTLKVNLEMSIDLYISSSTLLIKIRFDKIRNKVLLKEIVLHF